MTQRFMTHVLLFCLLCFGPVFYMIVTFLLRFLLTQLCCFLCLFVAFFVCCFACLFVFKKIRVRQSLKW